MYKDIKNKGQFKRCQVITNEMSKTLHLNNQQLVICLGGGVVSSEGGSQEVVRPITIAQLQMEDVYILYNVVIKIL
jgi:hypothetical protein